MGWLDTARRVVDTGTFAVVDPSTGEAVPDVEWDTVTQMPAEGQGVLLDMFSASTMVQIHDTLSPHLAERFAAMPVVKAHSIAFKMLARINGRNT